MPSLSGSPGALPRSSCKAAPCSASFHHPFWPQCGSPSRESISSLGPWDMLFRGCGAGLPDSHMAHCHLPSQLHRQRITREVLPGHLTQGRAFQPPPSVTRSSSCFLFLQSTHHCLPSSALEHKLHVDLGFVLFINSFPGSRTVPGTQ